MEFDAVRIHPSQSSARALIIHFAGPRNSLKNLHTQFVRSMPIVPKRMFFTKGVGRHKYELQSFEMALRDAGIEKFNLVSVSSIMPPGCRIVNKEDGLKDLYPGQIAFVVMSRNCTNEPNRMVAAAIGCAVPTEGSQYGYISEYHAFGANAETAGDLAEDLAATMLATTLGIPFDTDKDWDERENQYKMSGKIVKTLNITKTAEGEKSETFTTVLAAAVFVTDDPKDENSPATNAAKP